MNIKTAFKFRTFANRKNSIILNFIIKKH